MESGGTDVVAAAATKERAAAAEDASAGGGAKVASVAEEVADVEEKNGGKKAEKNEKGGEEEVGIVGGAKGDEEEEEEEVKGGEVLFCGCASWENVGRRGSEVSQTVTLVSPTRLSTLMNVDIAFVASGSASAHCVALDVNGRCYTWGRNEKGQLGHGDLLQRNTPTLVTALTRHVVVKAGAGRSHTVVVTEDGASLAFGWNKHGELGSGSLKEEAEKLPVRSLVTEVKHVVCGAEFTVWLSSQAGSSILTAGCPQYGQLGHGTDHEYNSKEGSVRLVYDPQSRPRAISHLTGKTITKVACGNNHTVAVDSDGYVYTWGFGGHGRLGHKEQKDEFVPRIVEVFQRTNTLPVGATVAAGSSFSAVTAGGGQLYMWGRVKSTGDNWMYPKPVMDLSGWHIRSMDCGNTSSFAAADSSCISWGTAVYGELGYGPTGPKSSASPKLVDVLEGMHILSVACGSGHSLVIVDRSKLPEKLEKLEVYSGHEIAPVDDEPEEKPAKTPAKGKSQNAKKRKTSTPSPATKKTKAKAVKKQKAAESEEEDENGQADSQYAGVKGKSQGRPKSRGKDQGKSDSRGASKAPTAKETKVKEAAAKRGRGRPARSQTKSTTAFEVPATNSSSTSAKRGKAKGRSRK